MSRGEIYSQISRAYSSSPFYSDVDRRKDRFQLYMIFTSGAVQLRDSGLRNAPIDYYTTAMEDASILADFPGQTQIQNTHLVMLFASHHDVGIGNHWDLARQAVRTCIQHGFHRAAVKPADPISEQMRRRLFWCSFIIDLHQSHSIGRPSAISEQDITIELPLDAMTKRSRLGWYRAHPATVRSPFSSGIAIFESWRKEPVESYMGSEPATDPMKKKQLLQGT
ncbi:hypothetical protein LTR06_001563 [Exophiala xenobiotica]|nr:hypothetical protein LTR06_001563 [Exophiala xenobiotica]